MQQSTMVPTLLVLLACLLPLATAFSSGAPSHRCSNLVPMHGFAPQSSSPPYELVVSANIYSPGDVIQVTLRGVSGKQFQGFAISAHRLTGDTEELVGSFAVPTNAQGAYWYNSSSLPNCVTHNGNTYSTITVNWTAPATSVGSVSFTSPVVESFSSFWTNVTSAVVVANVSSGDPPFPPLNIGSSASPISGTCGTDYGCVRSPALCDPASCELYVKFVYLDSLARVKIELQADSSYVAMGLSDDSAMSDDLTVTCSISGGNYSMQVGYNPNYRRLNERHRWTILADKYIRVTEDKRLKCEFTIPLSVNISTYTNPRQGSGGPTIRTFDFRNSYYVFIAYGELYSGTSSAIQHTQMPAISTGPVDFLARGSHSAHRISGLRRAHGSLMLLAWQLLIPLGANLALFYRSLFSKDFNGVQLWFHLHRGIVVSALIITIIALLLIFAQFGWQWSVAYATTQTHGAMGLAVLCLAAVQILMGILRPDKDSPRRPAFKIAHQAVAYCALGLADGVIITIGFLVTLPRSYMISHTTFAFTWLVFHVAFRIGVSIAQARWTHQILNAVDDKKLQAELEDKKSKMTRLLFAVFMAGMLIIFFAWFVTLMLF